ncbi:hypothetical protein PIB30_091495 [Stylosanthes scabra]|uniref:Uncharacterized protein n=1 Tax=Stylosanthes scabra TaxID=79078 RepID=A0ABU6TWI1_9FABA|nr:hypothetical protein [Stylosanthes scabra]
MALARSSSPHTLATPWQPRQPHAGTWLPPGNYKEKKLGAKHNLKEEEELKNQGNFKAGYRYHVAGYRYPRRKPTPNHVQAWIRRDPRPNPR